jgi:hypothetical protein
MDYTVQKLIFGEISDFDVKEESEDICKLCKVAIPRELDFIGPVCIGDVYVDLCPICARGIRNLILKQPVEMKFPGDEANRRYNRFISWQAQQKED